MSIEAVVARIGQITAAQQQLAAPVQSAPTAQEATSTSGPSTGATTSSATFAGALAAAQTPPGQHVRSGQAADAPSGVVVPQTSWNPQRKPIAAWIAPILQWASEHGWSGTVTSGYRTYQQQAALNAAGAYSAPAGRSNHEKTQYPGGAVDVTDPQQLLNVLQGYTGPQRLVGGVLGPVDPEHFSATGR
jgi:hypothetical protein